MTGARNLEVRAFVCTTHWELGRPRRSPTGRCSRRWPGIGNWFVRLQAKRYGAGLAVSEMISSFAIHYGNREDAQRAARRAPATRGRSAIQLFGHDPEIMRSAAAEVARVGADRSSTSTWAARSRR